MRTLTIKSMFTLNDMDQVFIVSMMENGLDAVNKGDRFEINGGKWRVRSVEDVRSYSDDDTMVGLVVDRIE